MITGCPRCAAPATIGVLCEPCAKLLPTCDSLIREHLMSRVLPISAAGWLIDGFGVAHALAAPRTTIGRRPQADVVILNSSVSRDHAELHFADGGWQLRDLGSRNRTLLDGRRVEGRASVPARGAQLRFGDVSFFFFGEAIRLPDPIRASIATAHAAGTSAFRYTLRGDRLDLCLIGPGGGVDDRGGGALMFRKTSATVWSETSLPPLEYQMLRTLCERAVEEASSPSRSRGCVATKDLAKQLPFHSGAPNEENVRQLVRRFRVTLEEIGAKGLIEALPGRGYYVGWPVVAS